MIQGAEEGDSVAYENIKTETRGAVGLITFDRPEALNALNAALVRELGDALDRFEADDAIGAVVITGNEKAFAAGADIKEMRDKSYMDAYLQDFITNGWERITTCRKPIVAAVAGYALGGGCKIAMMCDFALAAETARFGQPEITIGVIPGAGGTQRLPRAVGKAKAMEMVLTGRMMDAEEAERGRARESRRPGRGPHRRGGQGRRQGGGPLAPVDHDGQGIDRPRLRGDACRGHSLRAPAVPFDLRDGGSEGRHVGLYRKAEAGLQEPLGSARAAGLTPWGQGYISPPDQPHSVDIERDGAP